MKVRKRKNRVIIALVAIIGLMAVGYSLLSQQLNINGTANVTADWDVKITGITGQFVDGATNTDDSAPTFNDTTATFSVDLPQPGSSGVYTITVKNDGNIAAQLKEIPSVEAVNASDPTDVVFNVTVIDSKMELQPGEEAQIVVAAAWDPDSQSIPTTLTKEATITLDYEQITSQS